MRVQAAVCGDFTVKYLKRKEQRYVMITDEWLLVLVLVLHRGGRV